MTSKTRLSILLVSTPILAFVIVGGLIGQERPSGDRAFRHLRVFDDVVQLVMSNYVEDVKVDRAMEGALKGLADGLDPDSAYLDAKQVKSVSSGESLPDGDVGLELTRQYYLRVIAARDGSPAAKAGLQTGDFVRAIDSKPTRDMSVFEGTRLLRGAPGTKVTLTVIRGSAADPHDVVLVREKAAGAAVTSRLIGTDVGYLRVATLQERLGRGAQEAGGRPGEVRREVAADRSAADGGRSVRQRHRRRAAVREVRNAGDQGRPRQGGSHAGRGARQRRARSICRSRCW